MVEKKPKIQICPILSARKSALTPCLKEDCALYFIRDEVCSLVSIVYALDWLSDHIETLISKIAKVK